MAYPGTFLAVSHDRYFLDKVANCTLELADGKLTEYLGNYSYYQMKRQAEEEAAAEERAEREKAEQARREKEKAAERVKASAEAEKHREERAAKSQQEQQNRIQGMSSAKREEAVQRLEAQIAMAEAELKGLEFEMNDPAVQADPAKSQEIAEAYAAKEEEIEQLYEKWGMMTEA